MQICCFECWKTTLFVVSLKVFTKWEKCSNRNVPIIFSLFVCVVWLRMTTSFIDVLLLKYFLTLSKFESTSPSLDVNTRKKVKNCVTTFLISNTVPPVVWRQASLCICAKALFTNVMISSVLPSSKLPPSFFNSIWNGEYWLSNW